MSDPSDDDIETDIRIADGMASLKMLGGANSATSAELDATVIKTVGVVHDLLLDCKFKPSVMIYIASVLNAFLVGQGAAAVTTDDQRTALADLLDIGTSLGLELSEALNAPKSSSTSATFANLFGSKQPTGDA